MRIRPRYLCHDKEWISDLLAVYVDDLLIMGQREEDIDEVKDLLKNRYQMKDLGVARRFLGMDIDYAEDGSIKLHLKRYLSALLERHGMSECNPVSTPMDPSVRLIPAGDRDGLADAKEYQQIVGELQFASLVARPDISCAVGTLAQFNVNPTSTHLGAAKRVLRYLKGSADWELSIPRHLEKHRHSQMRIGPATERPGDLELGMWS